MTYKWKVKGVFKANAGKCKKEIDSLSEKTRENVVKFARNRNTELFKCFEWDNKKAAEKYRLEQAGVILRSIIFVTVIEDVEVPVRAFERGNNESNSAYRNVTESLNDDSFKQVIINRVKRGIDEIESVAINYQRFFNNPKEFKKAINAAKRAI